MPRFRDHIVRNLPPYTSPNRLLERHRRQAGFPAEHEHGLRERMRLDSGVEERRVFGDGARGEILEPGAQEARFGDLARVAVEVCGRDGGVAGVGGVEEVPGQHLLLAALDEELRGVGDGEEG